MFFHIIRLGINKELHVLICTTATEITVHVCSYGRSRENNRLLAHIKYFTPTKYLPDSTISKVTCSMTRRLEYC